MRNLLLNTLLSLVLLSLAVAPMLAQGEKPLQLKKKEGKSFFDYLSTMAADPVEITIRTDLTNLVNHKEQETYQPAEISLQGADGQVQNWKVGVRPRGNSRKQICYFPPIRMKFNKADLFSAGLDSTFSSFKIVNQCEEPRIYVQFLMREYLAYQLYQEVSPFSFRAKLLHVTYIDTGKKDRTVDLYAFLIEDSDELAAKHNGVVVDRARFSTSMVERRPLLEMSLFQYMIGNTDWAVGNLHNLELIKVPDIAKVISVPYDFDYSGLVNAPYAIPAEQLPIKLVTDRLYRGPSCSDEEFNAVVQRFIEIEPKLRQRCEQFTMLDKRHLKEIESYLNKFFEELKQPARLKRDMQE